jgi:hypothetical protein
LKDRGEAGKVDAMINIDSKYRRVLLAGAVISVFSVVAYAVAAKKTIVTPYENAKFVPLDPAHPQSAQLAVLSGDPATGPSSMLMKFAKGPGRLHIHSSDYHLVVIEGMMKHWDKQHPESEVKPIGPGGYWFQPGNEAHGDSCLSDECVMYVQWMGKRDTRPAG